ncbi:hypothetical protein DL89DRAFT_40205 [Linderina pennispora]|uniref:Uncharacterized protein n=1 Tax=Linderina pennispora TaxID=61395 RepID=A0A1Y1W3A6_9FUNG|nr:uncharacterized protein DL89DRAFT_40205 [Linderina pennispora]ORX68029.1 hypothetical protein DL89DRAFT_40205 [Linderina pennispora]
MDGSMSASMHVGFIYIPLYFHWHIVRFPISIYKRTERMHPEHTTPVFLITCTVLLPGFKWTFHSFGLLH